MTYLCISNKKTNDVTNKLHNRGTAFTNLFTIKTNIMYLQPLFTLYHELYPSVPVRRVVIGGAGASLVSLYDAGAVRSLSVAGLFRPAVTPASSTPSARRALLRFALSNRRELFMLREARCLSGLLYAENLSGDLDFMSLATGLRRRPRSEARGLRLTWLFPLSAIVSARRYALRAVSLYSNGTTYIEAQGRDARRVARVRAGGSIVETYDALSRRFLPLGDVEAHRYARLFCRDNARWFAAFASGQEAGEL